MGRFLGNHQPAMPPSQTSRPGGRPIPLLKGALGAAVALAALSLSTGSAHAACAAGSVANTLCRVTVGGLQYDVTLFTGKYNDNTSKFATAANGGVMPWWTGGSSATAIAFATAVGNSLGSTQNNNFGTLQGPIFAYKSFSGAVISMATIRDSTQSISDTQWLKADTGVFAQATLYSPPASPVEAPGPLPLFGAGAAFGFSRQLRKRIQGARLQVSSSQPRA